MKEELFVFIGYCMDCRHTECARASTDAKVEEKLKALQAKYEVEMQKAETGIEANWPDLMRLVSQSVSERFVSFPKEEGSRQTGLS